MKKNLYFCFPISGPNNGVKVISSHIYEYLKTDSVFDIILIDMAQATQFKNFGRFGFKKIFHSIELIKAAFKVNDKSYVYLNLTPKGLALIRDLVLLSVFLFKSCNITIHLHANGLEKQANTLVKFILKRTKIITINADQKKRINALGLNCKPLDNALPDYFIENRRTIKKENLNKIKLLFFSNLCKKKGVLRLKRIADQIANDEHFEKLTICGGVLNDQAEEILGEILKISSKIQYLGPITNEKEKFNLFLEHSFLLFLSDENYEVSPLVYIEALMAGLPIISTPQVVAHDLKRRNSLFLLENTYENLEDLIKPFLKNNTLFHDLKLKCRNTYEEKYSFDVYLQRLIAIIKE